MNMTAMRAALLFGGGGGPTLRFDAQDAGKHLIVGQDGRVTAVYAGSGGGAELADWTALAQAAAAGRLAVGDTVKNSWTDTAAAQSCDNPLRVNHLCAEQTESGAVVKGAWLQTQYAHPFGLQFSQYQAILACADGLAAGTYSFTFGDTVGNSAFVRQGTAFHFTLKQAVPAGGLLAGLRGCVEAADPYTALKITVYAADRKTLLETADIAAGADGVHLGTLTQAGDDRLNAVERFAYGDNGWARSALRQYLNSDKPRGGWWTPQSPWDLAPDGLDSRDGYLCGTDPALTALLQPVRVLTYGSGVCTADSENGDTPHVTYDRVTLPAVEQMYFTPETGGEGSAQTYYRQGRAGDTPYLPGQANPALRTYTANNRRLPQIVRLRTALRSTGGRTRVLTGKGQADSSPAAAILRFAPMVFIGA